MVEYVTVQGIRKDPLGWYGDMKISDKMRPLAPKFAESWLF